MGLDWMVQPKGKPGFEQEAELNKKRIDELSEQFNDGDKTVEVQLEELRRLNDEILISPYSCLDCPRVGIDKEGTEWWVENRWEPSRKRIKEETGILSKEFREYWDRPMEDVLEDEKGRWVPDLAKNTEGISPVNGMICGPIDFRGKIIGYAKELGTDITERAYRNHSAEECLDYAVELEDAINQAKNKDTLQDDCGGKAKVEELYRAAVTWLNFWGKNGFGFYAWY